MPNTTSSHLFQPKFSRISALLWLVAAMAAVCALGVACGPVDNDPGTGTGNNGGSGTGSSSSVCEDDSNLEGCFDACSSTADCRAGMYCRAASFCDADCDQKNDCSGNLTCNSEGRCVLETDPTLCPPQSVDVKGVVPNIVFLVDRSTSMGYRFEPKNPNNTDSRWKVVGDTLFGPTGTNGVIHDLQGLAHMGLSLFTTGGTQATYCTSVLETADVKVNAANDMHSLFANNAPSGGTPTGPSIKYLRTLGLLNKIANDPELSQNPTVLVLATDGRPLNACTTGDPGASNGHEQYVVDQVTAAYNEGVTTFVIGLPADDPDTPQDDTPALGAHLTEVARAGQNDPNATYTPTSNPDELKQAILDIADAALSCDIRLSKSLSDVDAACKHGDVFFDGTKLICGDPTGGWEVVDKNTIRLTGTTCDAWKDGTKHDLSASFPCSAVVE